MKKILSISRYVGGFTMIELLIVISILGILAVAVLSAINPVEQINRGRDTASRSDAEQLISAIDRFTANQTYLPWQSNANDPVLGIGGSGGTAPVIVDTTGPVDHRAATATTPCNILNRLSTNDAVTPVCAAGEGTNELKASFVSRITNVTGQARALYIYNNGQPGDSTYVCFAPRSNAFSTEASNRCKGNGATVADGDGMPADMSTEAKAFICDITVNGQTTPLHCLP